MKISGKPQRTIMDNEFADLTAVPIVAMQWIADGVLEAEFASDVTPAVAASIVQRMQSRNGNEETLRNQATNALQNNRDFLAIVGPTNAQVLAQVKALSRQSNGVIRMLLGQIDGTD